MKFFLLIEINIQTAACDLRSTLALTMKRHILQELEKGCPNLKEDTIKQKKILNEFGHYLNNYSSEEIEWYGYPFQNALNKLENELRWKAQSEIIPEKIIFRQKLIKQLRENELSKSSETDVVEE